MAATDWFDYDDFDERDGTEPVTCKRCGAGDLTWEWDGRWVLIEGDKPHSCAAHRLAAFSAFLRRMKP